MFEWLLKKKPFQPDKPSLAEDYDKTVILDTAWLVRALKDKE